MTKKAKRQDLGERTNLPRARRGFSDLQPLYVAMADPETEDEECDGNAKFHRVPPGQETYSNKLAPSVDLDGASVAELTRWKIEDEGSPWVFPAMHGGPLGYDHQALIFTSRLAELGIDATGHALRHSFVTKMIAKGMGSSTIASIAGLSMRMMHDRYDHRDHGPVQALAHGVMGTMF